jgi:4-hydroxythreonine-4-phosphate dehydrogenase
MKPILGIMLGDATGVGPEIIAKMIAADMFSPCCRPLFIGDARVLAMGAKIAGVSCNLKTVTNVKDVDLNKNDALMLDLHNLDPSSIVLGQMSIETGRISGEDLVTCLELLKSGVINGLTFAPLNKQAMKKGGFNYSDEHRMFAAVLNWTKPHGEINVMKEIWTTRVTSHIPISEVAANITEKNILDAIRLADGSMRKYGFENPRLAVAALNPHCGEGGTCGREEIDVIAPAVAKAVQEGINAKGPISADTVATRAIMKKEFDGIVTMYHDQGQVAIKLIGPQYCVTISGGLPYPITTPAHGTAYDIAGKGIAHTTTVEQALLIAARMAGWRDK